MLVPPLVRWHLDRCLHDKVMSEYAFPCSVHSVLSSDCFAEFLYLRVGQRWIRGVVLVRALLELIRSDELRPGLPLLSERVVCLAQSSNFLPKQ